MRIKPSIGALASLVLVLTACGSDDDADTGGSASDSAGDNGGAEPVTDGTFTTTVTADPGNLHPHMTVLSATRAVVSYMYDKLVYFTPDGETQPWLAESWDATANSITYTIREDVTCADGTELTASDVAANFEFVDDPANESPLRGSVIPAELEVSADDDARTVTIETASPDPFLLHSTSEMFIVCQAGLDDPSTLAEAGNGTGMFELTDSAADDHYTFERRDDYAWGPDGMAAADAGTPATVTLRVVPSESTAVNLFLSGELDAVSAVGPDRQRLESEYDQVSQRAAVGELFFNQAEGRPGSDPEVRAALAQGLDFTELMSVITGGYGAMSTSVATLEPAPCQYDAVSGTLPEPDPEAAQAALDAAGWTAGSDGVRTKDGNALTIQLIYASSRGDATAAAAELIAQRWSEIGVDAATRGMPPTEYNEVVFGTGAWDAALLPVNVRLPSQVVSFFSGPTPSEGGVNFAHIANEDYQATVGEAMQIPGQEGCDTWKEAEQALYEARDVVLFADETIPTFLDGATLELGSEGIIPTTIRMSAGS